MNYITIKGFHLTPNYYPEEIKIVLHFAEQQSVLTASLHQLLAVQWDLLFQLVSFSQNIIYILFILKYNIYNISSYIPTIIFLLSVSGGPVPYASLSNSGTYKSVIFSKTTYLNCARRIISIPQILGIVSEFWKP